MCQQWPSSGVSMVSVRRLVVVFAALVLSMALLWLAPTTAQAETTEIDGVVYTYTPGDTAAGAVASSHTRTGGALVLPATIEVADTAYPVVAVGPSAFKGAQLTSVQLPDSVVTLGPSAFEGNRLTSLSLPPGLATIPDAAFKYNELTALTVPDTVTWLGDSAFEFNEISSLDLGESVTHIGRHAFEMNALTTVVLPDSVTSMGYDAFESNQISSLTLGNGLDVIPDVAFSRNLLTTVTIPANVTSVNLRAFDENPDLQEVVFLGPAPAIVDGGMSDESLDTASGALVVRYQPEYDAGVVQGGFTAGTWHGYTTAMVGSPTIEGPTTATFTVGVPATWEPTSLTGDPAPVVTASGLPEGLAVDPTTGVISGTALARAGEHEVVLTAGNGRLPEASLTVALTVAPGAVESLTVTVSDAAPEQGDTITLQAAAADAAGNDLGDVTEDVVFSSDVATDIVDGDQITFPHASPHVITATHQPTGTTASISLEVAPAVTPPDDDVDDPDVADPDDPAPDDDDSAGPADVDDPADTSSAALPDTGAPAHLAGLLGLGSAMLLGGLLMLTRARRTA